MEVKIVLRMKVVCLSTVQCTPPSPTRPHTLTPASARPLPPHPPLIFHFSLPLHFNFSLHFSLYFSLLSLCPPSLSPRGPCQSTCHKLHYTPAAFVSFRFNLCLFTSPPLQVWRKSPISVHSCLLFVASMTTNCYCLCSNSQV